MTSTARIGELPYDPTMDDNNETDNSTTMFGHCFDTQHSPNWFNVVGDICFLIVGLIGNICLITISLRYKKMRTVPNYLITNLAIVDTAFLLMFLPQEIMREVDPKVVFLKTELGCKSYFYLRIVFLGVSIFTLTALSIDRYLAVSKPLAFRLVRSGRNRLFAVLFGIALIWLSALLLALPNLHLTYFNMYGYHHCRVNIRYNPDVTIDHPTFVYMLIAMYLVIPTCIISGSYCCTAKSLLKPNDLLKHNCSAGAKVSSRQRHQRLRLAVAVIIIVVVFVTTWCFYFAVEIFKFIEGGDLIMYMDHLRCMEQYTWYTVLEVCSRYTLRINSVINPIILFIVSSSHRHYVKEAFCCCLADKKTHRPFGKMVRASFSMSAQTTVGSRIHNTDDSRRTKRELQV